MLRLGTALTAVGGVALCAAVQFGIAHWSLLLAAQFIVMMAHGLNQPCAQAGVVASFATRAGAAAGLFGFLTMTVALLVGTALGLLHDGSLRPLAWLAAVVGLLALAAGRLPRDAVTRQP